MKLFTTWCVFDFFVHVLLIHEDICYLSVTCFFLHVHEVYTWVVDVCMHVAVGSVQVRNPAAGVNKFETECA